VEDCTWFSTWKIANERDTSYNNIEAPVNVDYVLRGTTESSDTELLGGAKK